MIEEMSLGTRLIYMYISLPPPPPTPTHACILLHTYSHVYHIHNTVLHLYCVISSNIHLHTTLPHTFTLHSLTLAQDNSEGYPQLDIDDVLKIEESLREEKLRVSRWSLDGFM